MRSRPLLGSVAGGALAATAALAGLAPAPAAQADPTAVDPGADWLVTQIDDGVVNDPQWGPDYSLSIDAARALAAVGAHQAEVDDVLTAMSTHVEDYVTFAGVTSGGSLGKLLAFVTDEGADETAFGGENLVSRLESLVIDEGAAAGRVTNSGGEFDANVFGQTYAVHGLLQSESATEDAAALDFLLQQQCDEGFFRLYFTDDKSAPDQTCDGADEEVPPVDVSALVVIELHQLATADPDLEAALDAAVDWIVKQQAEDGSFRGSGVEGPNANSTGLAGWALHLAGETQAAARAATWIRGLQVPGLACDRKVEPEIGAIAYDPATYEAGVEDGIGDADLYQWRTAAVQALPALQAAPTGGDLAIAAPRFIEGGTRVDFQVTGMAPGERGCVSFGRKTAPVVADQDGNATVDLRAAEKTFRRTVQAETTFQSDAHVAVVLGATTVPVKLRNEVEPRGAQRVVVSGLREDERVSVRHAGEKIVGRADADGRFVVVVDAPRRRGTYQVTARGQFADRRGAASYQVG